MKQKKKKDEKVKVKKENMKKSICTDKICKYC